MASETDDGDDSIADILAASDELSRVIDRYKFAVLRRSTDSSTKRDRASSNANPAISRTTMSRPLQRKNSEELLDLGGGGGLLQGGELSSQIMSIRKLWLEENIW